MTNYRTFSPFERKISTLGSLILGSEHMWIDVSNALVYDILTVYGDTITLIRIDIGTK